MSGGRSWLAGRTGRCRKVPRTRVILACVCAGRAGDSGFQRVSMAGARILVDPLGWRAAPDANFALRSLQSRRRIPKACLVTGLSGLNLAPAGPRAVPEDRRHVDGSITNLAPAG